MNTIVTINNFGQIKTKLLDKVSENSNQKQAIIEINDIFEELNEENKKLKNELLFANKCLLVLNKINEFYGKYFNECKCYSKPINDLKLNEFENQYKDLMKEKNQELIFNNNNNENYESFDCDFNESNNESEEVEENKFSFVKENDNKSPKIVKPEKCLTLSERRKLLLLEINKKNGKRLEMLKTMKNKKKGKRIGLIDVKKIICDPNSKYNDPDWSPSEEEKNYKVVRPFSTPEGRAYYKKRCQKFKCHYEDCGYGTDKQLRLDKHIAKHSEIGIFTCQQNSCKKKLINFKTEEQFKYHNKHTHGITDTFVCDHKDCKYKVRDEFKFQVHQRKHMGDQNPYHCQWIGCELSFRKGESYKNHLLKHEGILPFRCVWPSCEFGFYKQSRLTQHINSAHLGIKNFACDWPQCDKKFVNNVRLKKHKLVHTGVKDFICEWPGCEAKFSLTTHLKRHRFIHTGLKPFVCEWSDCGKSFNQKINLKTHYNNIHLKNMV